MERLYFDGNLFDCKKVVSASAVIKDESGCLRCGAQMYVNDCKWLLLLAYIRNVSSVLVWFTVSYREVHSPPTDLIATVTDRHESRSAINISQYLSYKSVGQKRQQQLL